MRYESLDLMGTFADNHDERLGLERSENRWIKHVCFALFCLCFFGVFLVV